jgi:hypothetical protein
MPERPFMDQERKPTEQTLQTALGVAYGPYSKLLGLAGGYAQSWAFGRSGGWMLKVHDRKKALLYLIPLHGGFRASMAIREAERDAFLADGQLASIRAKLEESRKCPEGFALQFDVTDASELAPLAAFVGKLIAMRGV